MIDIHTDILLNYATIITLMLSPFTLPQRLQCKPLMLMISERP